jgi:hypothetical protein
MSDAQSARVLDLDEEDLNRREEDEEDEEDKGEVKTPGEPDTKKARTGRKKSWVHNYMHQTEGNLVCDVKVQKLVDEKWMMVACGREYRYDPKKPATSAPRKHLMDVHKFSKTGEPPEQTRQARLTVSGDGTAKLDVVVKWTAQDPRSVSMVDDLARWFALDGEPPNIVTHAGFQAFMEKRHPSFPGVSPPTITARLKAFTEGFAKWFIEFQEQVEWFGVTTDGWSSDAKEHYRTFTLHFFIPGSWQLVGMVLDTAICGGKDEQIAEFLLGVIGKYRLLVSRIVAVTTDNANAEVAGVRLADLQRVACGCHVLNLTMKLVTDPGKPAKGARPARLPSPVFATLDKLQKFVQKLHNAPLLMQALNQRLKAWALRFNQATPRIPTKPNNTRWNSTCLMLETCYPIRDEIDRLLVTYAATYSLEPLTAHEWKVVGEMAALLHPFKTVSNYMEGEKYPTVPEYLGHLAGACFTAFYQNVGNHRNLEHSVQMMLLRLRDDLGRRLWDTVNDVTLTGLMLHPVFKNLAPPGAGFPQSALTAGSIASFFFSNLKSRMATAALNEIKRLAITNDVVAAPVDNNNPLSLIVQGFNAAVQKKSKPEHEINAWLGLPVSLTPVAEWWEREGSKFPLLQKLARANFVAQGSGAAAERVWSAADDVSGGDRASVSPEVLSAQLMLKKNTPVQAKIMGCSLFDALKK